jgi:hypothetical protein
LKVGDKVRVVRTPEEYEQGWEPMQSGIDLAQCGDIGFITNDYSSEGFELDNMSFVPWFVLELVEPQFKPFDKVLVRDNAADIWEPRYFALFKSVSYADPQYGHFTLNRFIIPLPPHV